MHHFNISTLLVLSPRHNDEKVRDTLVELALYSTSLFNHFNKKKKKKENTILLSWEFWLFWLDSLKKLVGSQVAL